CEIFICEITRRAWLHAEENKRRTLQRSDVASAVSKSDQFDFLIDIVPREEPTKPTNKRSSTREDTAQEGEVYDEQQQYAQYYPQGPGGLASYPQFDPQLYHAVSHDQFQQYMQYHAYAQQQQQVPPAQGGPAAAAASQQHHSRSGSVGYAQEATSRQN
ncbi:hypothetical protein BGZ99_002926, partial [Dissophora globulifera]